jgi:hypothetical protein
MNYTVKPVVLLCCFCLVFWFSWCGFCLRFVFHWSDRHCSVGAGAAVGTAFVRGLWRLFLSLWRPPLWVLFCLGFLVFWFRFVVRGPGRRCLVGAGCCCGGLRRSWVSVALFVVVAAFVVALCCFDLVFCFSVFCGAVSVFALSSFARLGPCSVCAGRGCGRSRRSRTLAALFVVVAAAFVGAVLPWFSCFLVSLCGPRFGPSLLGCLGVLLRASASVTVRGPGRRFLVASGCCCGRLRWLRVSALFLLVVAAAFVVVLCCFALVFLFLWCGSCPR